MGEDLEVKDGKSIDIDDGEEIIKEDLGDTSNASSSENLSSSDEEGVVTEASKVKELEEKLEKLEAENSDLKNQYLRAHADLENFKKRTQREVSDFKKYAVEAIVKQLLPVFDNLERAILSSETDNNGAPCQITDGIKMTLGEVDKVFEQFSIKVIDAQGEKFNPAFHMAVAQEERDDLEENTVVSQFQKGYLLHDRLLRPAMVTVAKAKPKSDAEAEEQNISENLDQVEDTQE